MATNAGMARLGAAGADDAARVGGATRVTDTAGSGVGGANSFGASTNLVSDFEVALKSKAGTFDEAFGSGANVIGLVGVATESNTVRVGRWMSQVEYEKMIRTGKVQMSSDNKAYVANPANIEAFGAQALPGSIYVEFDVTGGVITQGGVAGWGIINGPGSLIDRLNAKKGLPRILDMPDATNIQIKGNK